MLHTGITSIASSSGSNPQTPLDSFSILRPLLCVRYQIPKRLSDSFPILHHSYLYVLTQLILHQPAHPPPQNQGFGNPHLQTFDFEMPNPRSPEWDIVAMTFCGLSSNYFHTSDSIEAVNFRRGGCGWFHYRFLRRGLAHLCNRTNSSVHACIHRGSYRHVVDNSMSLGGVRPSWAQELEGQLLRISPGSFHVTCQPCK